MSTSYEQLISGLSPSVWFKFDGTTTPPTNFGSDSNATITTTTGTPTLNQASDISNQSVYFDGNAAYQVTGSRTPGVLSDDIFSIEFWFKAGSTATYHTFFNLYNSSTGGWINLRAGSAGNVEFNYIAGTGKKFVELKSPSTSLLDNKWHHVVGVRNSTNIYLYVDGSQVATDTYQSGQTFGSTADTGAFQIARREGSVGERLTGYLDEFAIYSQALTSTEIGENYLEGSSFEYLDTPKTASALFVMPTVQIGITKLSDVLTASALFAEAAVSNYNVQDSLENYMANTATPEQWYKFDAFPFVNSGSGGTAAFFDFGTIKRKVGEGPDKGSSLELAANFSDGYIYTTSTTALSTEVSDGNFSLGTWFKFGSDLTTNTKGIMELAVSASNKIYIRVVDKKVRFGLVTSSATYEHTTTAATYNDNVWHFGAIRWDGTNLYFYLDGSQVYTTTTSGTISGLNVMTFGGAGISADTYKWQLAHPFIGTYSGIDHTKLSAIYNAGTRTLQGGAGFVEPKITNNNAYNDYIESLNPVLDLRFDGSGVPVNYSTSTTVSYSIDITGTNYSTGVSTKNTRGYNFTNKNTGVTGSYNGPTNTFSDNTKTVSVYAKMASASGTDSQIYYTDQQFTSTPGISITATAGGPTFAVTPTLTQANWKAIYAGTGYYDGKYHLFTAVRNGTNLKFYVDGKSVGTTTITGYSQTDSGGYAIGGLETVYFGASAATVDKNIDEVQVFDYALTDAQVFEMWQKIGVDAMNTTNATFPTPVGTAGYGPTISASPSYASALLVDPTQQDTVAPTILPMTVFGEFTHPNFAATSTVNIAADPATASGVFHDPQFNIGENNSVDHMNASALFVNPQVLIPGFWNANPMIATNATLVDPTFVSTLGGLVLAQPMTVTAGLVVPPAYKSLFEDKWYDLLYSQHSQRHNVRVTNGGNGEAILKLFDDVTSSVSLSTPLANRTLVNNLTVAITTDGTVGEEEVPVMSVTGDFNPSSNTPIISAGFFDAYERKAVRFNNITCGYENSEYSNFGFSFEMSIKTTKSNQIIAFGRTRSYTAYSQFATSLGLSDGKLFLKTTSNIGPAPISHYKESTVGNTVLGNKRIDDGQWHHIVVQYGWDDSRIQFWIDGDLDIQRIRGIRLDGLSFLGFNSNTATYASDFYTSAWSYDTHRFILDNEVDDHRYKFIKYQPVLATPMTASTASGDHLAAGNRGRALMLYWWPTDTFQGNYVRDIPFNKQNWPDVETWTKELTTADFIKSGPQEYYGWDVFPVDITGYFVSELVKPEAYGGKENILVGSKPFIGTGQNYNTNPEFLYNSQGAFKDPVTDDNRYIDVVNDIDLRNFDAIFFKNFPDEAAEKDSYTKNEVVDTYFGLKESALYEAFIKSLRAAVDTGVSLYITNPQLALDLGIVDRVETVPDMDDLSGFDSDPYSPTIVPTNAAGYPIAYSAQWYDSNKNNRLRIVNELEGFTTEPSFIYTDYAYYKNDDQITFGGPNRPFYRYVYRPDGLRVGDEFIISNDARGSQRDFYAVPFTNVKAGTIITAFANNVRRRLDLIENPYKNYATTIVVKPGDVLNGTQCGGKIVVNFTENLNGAVDWGNVDLISDYWINIAYNDEYIDLATKNTLLAAEYNIDRQLENNDLTQAEYNKLAYWSDNGSYVISQATIIDDPTASQPKDGIGKGVRSSIVTKTRKSGTAYSARVSTQSQWFSFEYSYLYPRMGIKVPNILTRGFWWLSNRESYEGLVQRPLVATATALLPMPAVIAQKDLTVNVPSMVSSGRLVEPVGVVNADAIYAPLPMTATGVMNNYVTRYLATPMTASAALRTNTSIFTTAVDEVVVYVYHTDPILYLREDVIK